MVYLENKTELQEVWIPKNDGSGCIHTGSSHSYEEGFEDGYESGTTDQKNKLVVTAFTENGVYSREDGWSGVTVNVSGGSPALLEDKTVVISADTTVVRPSSGFDGMSAVTVDASDYGQSQYDDGFDDGFTDGYSSGHTDGIDDQKAKLSATTFTANTAVTLSDGGYSAVTVNVPQTGHTDQELEDAYQSGYTSGETYQKGLLTTTAFTENGSYSRENGWSGVTVNIDTASTWNSGYTSGYTSGHTDGVDEEKAKMSAVTFTANTAVTLSDGSYSAVTVNVPQTGTTAVLGVGSFSANGTYSASTDNLDGYSAITVNVQDATDSTISVTGNTWYVLDHKFRTGEKIEVTNATFDPTAATTLRHQQFIGGGGGEWVRIGGTGNDLYTSYYGDNKITYGPIVLNDDHILLTNGAFYINDMTTPVSGFGPYSTGIVEANNMVVFANTSSGNDCVSGQTATVGVITIYNENDNIVAKYIPTLHNGAACFYNPISDTYISPSGTGTPSIIISQSDEGYSDGYGDGQDSVIATFTAATATTNGVYGSSASPLSSITVNVPQTGSTAVLGVGSFSANGTYSASTYNLDGYSAITVNVPQSGGSGVKYIEYLETDGTNIVYDTGINITSNNVKVYLDYMRLSGSNENYLSIVSQVYNDRQFSYAFFVPGNWNTRNGVMPRFGGDNYEVPSLLDTYYETVVSNTGTTINGVDYPHTFTGFQETNEHMYLNAQHYYGNFRRFAIARYYRFAVESGGTLLVDLRPCLDENDVPCFYDEVSETYIYHTGSGTPIAGPVIQTPDYQSGYTDGYSSGYTDGWEGAFDEVENNAQTLSVSANGTYSTSLRADGYLWNEVVVNVDTATTYNSGYTDGYNSGTTDGYNSGTTDGYNSGYTDGFNSGYTSGVTDGENNIVSTFSSMTATTNGVYGSSANPYSSVTVNVPQTAYTYDITPIIDGTLTSIDIPSGCSGIRTHCFDNQRYLSAVTIPDTVTEIGTYAFNSCKSLKEITIPDSVTIIYYCAFENCQGLTGLTLSNNLTDIQYNAFNNCTGLTGSLVIPDSVTDIGSAAFTRTSFSSVTIGSGVTNLKNAFMFMGNLRTVVLGENISAITMTTFSGATSLRTIYSYNTTAPDLDNGYAFEGISSTGTVHYPQGSDYSSWQSSQYISGWTFVGDL